MSIFTVTFVIGILSIVGSLIAAYLAYVVYKYNFISRGWLALSLAFILIIFRRCLRLIIEFGAAPNMTTAIIFTENILLLIISALNIWGLWSLKKSFDSLNKRLSKSK